MSSVSKRFSSPGGKGPALALQVIGTDTGQHRGTFFFFFNLGRKSTSNGCHFNAAELSKTLTICSVFSKIPFGWFSYCLPFTNKEAEFPRSY